MDTLVARERKKMEAVPRVMTLAHFKLVHNVRQTAQINSRERRTYLLEEKRNFIQVFQKNLQQKTRQPTIKYLQITLVLFELQEKYIYPC